MPRVNIVPTWLWGQKYTLNSWKKIKTSGTDMNVDCNISQNPWFTPKYLKSTKHSTQMQANYIKGFWRLCIADIMSGRLGRCCHRGKPLRRLGFGRNGRISQLWGRCLPFTKAWLAKQNLKRRSQTNKLYNGLILLMSKRRGVSEDGTLQVLPASENFGRAPRWRAPTTKWNRFEALQSKRCSTPTRSCQSSIWTAGQQAAGKAAWTKKTKTPRAASQHQFFQMFVLPSTSQRLSSRSFIHLAKSQFIRRFFLAQLGAALDMG